MAVGAILLTYPHPAFAVLGAPMSSRSAYSFFNENSFVCAGTVFSPSDVCLG